MPVHIKTPTSIKAAGSIAKTIMEYVGCINTQNKDISIAKMNSPIGWEESGQTPEFDEYTLVLEGTLKVESKESIVHVKSGEVILVHKGEWVRYSTPFEDTCYFSVCIPAFSPEKVHRDI